jgi:hypothetical protein
MASDKTSLLNALQDNVVILKRDWTFKIIY